jgi:DNA-binding CsgD family transcriptional regulator
MTLNVQNHAAINGITRTLCSTTEIDEALDLVGNSLQRIGLSRLVYALTSSPRRSNGRLEPLPQIFWNFPINWERDFDFVRHLGCDPYLHACFDGHLTIDWQEIQRDSSLDAGERSFVENSRRVNLCKGLTVPIHMPGGEFAYMSFVGDYEDRHWSVFISEIKSSLFFLAHHFNHMVTKKFGGLRPTGEHDFHGGGHLKFQRGERSRWLTQREKECLFWSAQGKTVEDIGTILDISTDTVKIYLKRINVKLHASNRCHAVAKAIQRGLIDVTEAPRASIK